LVIAIPCGLRSSLKFILNYFDRSSSLGLKRLLKRRLFIAFFG